MPCTFLWETGHFAKKRKHSGGRREGVGVYVRAWIQRGRKFWAGSKRMGLHVCVGGNEWHMLERAQRRISV